jgi:hypothetical protein
MIHYQFHTIPAAPSPEQAATKTHYTRNLPNQSSIVKYTALLKKLEIKRAVSIKLTALDSTACNATSK